MRLFGLFSCYLLTFHIIFSSSFHSSQHQCLPCCLDFSFFLQFCCLINLLGYLESGAGEREGTGAAAAGAEVGAGAGVGVGAGAGARAGKSNQYED